MATQQVYKFSQATIATAQTGNAVSTDVADLSSANLTPTLGYDVVQIVTTVGATPTCTYLIEGSLDGANWYPLSIADMATPTTVAQTTFAITTATTVRKVIQPYTPCRFVRVTMSANTNVTSTITVYSL